MNKLYPLLMAATFTVALAGCAKEEGPMEKMGKGVDEAAESVEKSAEEAADSVKEAVEG
jgi:PBP1b-binding outer membrane lipoprotein LpoB